jgi:hypothetical protein
LASNNIAANTDLVFASNALAASKAPQLLSETTGVTNDDFFAHSNKEEEVSAIDKIFQDHNKWLESRG